MSHSAHHINSPEELQSLLSSTTYVVVDFFADWCPPCKAIAPIFEQLASKHTQPKYLAFAKVNVDKVDGLAATYQITAMPTFMFFKEGKQVAVNGESLLRGANPAALGSAVEKLSGLATAKAGEASA
ncbi:hypothetical protein E4U34_001414 [Claviceps purpurea]|nr:hypothetical protein E4U51_000032 [Claviceps purpurea]KAG6192250.1 hypothetical protein E4U27_003555 [Claviceps purpurea]KAG6222491.1 hypothetical protein E4U34_001414 [Claviceps purpurea]KAG6228145.1 hypothetical protein E4U26_001214 [Claviceps purpurea]KAG6244811.1 hypothetical protein E4U23_005887 [Claviceps purpurea]